MPKSPSSLGISLAEAVVRGFFDDVVEGKETLTRTEMARVKENDDDEIDSCAAGNEIDLAQSMSPDRTTRCPFSRRLFCRQTGWRNEFLLVEQTPLKEALQLDFQQNQSKRQLCSSQHGEFERQFCDSEAETPPESDKTVAERMQRVLNL